MPNRKTLAAAAMVAAISGGVVLGAALGNPFGAGASPSAEDPTTSTTVAPDHPGPGDQDGPGRRGPGPAGFDLEVAADTLGLSTDELQTQLQDGKTLAQVAEAKGVDEQDLIDALVKAGEARLDEAKSQLPDRIAELVESPMPTRGPGGPGGPGHGPGRGHGPGLDAAAKALGIDTEELRTQLQDGKTIAEVAKAEGVDVQKVIDAMVADAEEHLASEVEEGHLTQDQADQRLAELTDRITTMVEEGKPAGPPEGPGGPGGN